MERLKLNLVPGGVLTVCHASQYDNGRTVRFDLYDGDSKATLAGTETITATLRKPSGAEVTLNVANTSSDYVDVVTDFDTCDEAGVYLGELTVVSGSVIIGSANFILQVELDPYGAVQLVVRSASGSIVNFNTSVAEDLVECVAEFSASQASGTPTPAAPIPIVGVDKVSIIRTGKNLCPNKTYERNAQNVRLGVDSLDGRLKYKAGTYTISLICPLSTNLYYSSNGVNTNINATTSGTKRVATFTLSEDTELFFYAYNVSGLTSADISELQLETGSTATDYEEAHVIDKTINLGDTYYGGSVDAVTGKKTKTWLMTEIDENSDITWRADSNVAKIDVASPYLKYRAGGEDAKSNELEFMRVTGLDGVTEEHFAVLNNSGSNTATAVVWKVTGITSKADMLTWLSTHPLQILTNIATPETEYASNTAEIPTIVGDNQVFADTGDVVVKYYAKSTD